MSATGRGSPRNEDDFYATPAWAVHRLLEAWTPPSGMWLEPGAGNGAIIRAAGKRGIWTGVDLRSVPKDLWVEWFVGDFLSDKMLAKLSAHTRGNGFDAAIGNPPYLRAQQFADRCFQLASQTALLLRLNFLGSEERWSWWKRHPADIYILPNRPSFCVKVKCVVEACGRRETYGPDEKLPSFCLACHGKLRVTRTDATEYAWFVWHGQKRPSRVHHLALTPAAARNRITTGAEAPSHGVAP